jgi:hypothetical protein
MALQKTIILLHGKKRVGKDTTASFLKEELDAEIISLSKPMKKIAADTLQLNLEAVEQLKNKEDIKIFKTEVTELSMRDVLQNLGQSVKKHIYPNIWAMLTEQIIANSNKNVFVITDIRLAEEYNYFISKYGKNKQYKLASIKIKRTTDNSDTHLTEQGLPDDLFTTIIDNDGLIPELQEKIKTFLIEYTNSLKSNYGLENTNKLEIITEKDFNGSIDKYVTDHILNNPNTPAYIKNSLNKELLKKEFIKSEDIIKAFDNKKSIHRILNKYYLIEN